MEVDDVIDDYAGLFRLGEAIIRISHVVGGAFFILIVTHSWLKPHSVTILISTLIISSANDSLL